MRSIIAVNNSYDSFLYSTSGSFCPYARLPMPCFSSSIDNKWSFHWLSITCNITLRNDILTQFGYKIDLKQLGSLNRQEITNAIVDQLQSKYQEKEDLVGPDVMRQTERIVMLQVIDNQWKDHLLSMDELK